MAAKTRKPTASTQSELDTARAALDAPLAGLTTGAARRYDATHNAAQYVPVLVVGMGQTYEGRPCESLADAKAAIRTARAESNGAVDGFVAVKRVDVIFVSVE